MHFGRAPRSTGTVTFVLKLNKSLGEVQNKKGARTFQVYYVFVI